MSENYYGDNTVLIVAINALSSCVKCDTLQSEHRWLSFDSFGNRLDILYELLLTLNFLFDRRTFRNFS